MENKIKIESNGNNINLNDVAIPLPHQSSELYVSIVKNQLGWHERERNNLKFIAHGFTPFFIYQKSIPMDNRKRLKAYESPQNVSFWILWYDNNHNDCVIAIQVSDLSKC